MVTEEAQARGLPHNLRFEGSWFGFVEAEGDLDNTERNVVTQFGDWLNTVETTSLNKSYKMVVLRVLVDSGQLFSGIDLYELANGVDVYESRGAASRSRRRETGAVDHENASDLDWAEWWIKWPIGRWLDAQGKRFGLNETAIKPGSVSSAWMT